MDAVLRLVLAVLVGAVVAMGIPREIGREYRWSVAWEQSFDRDISGSLAAKSTESIAEYFPVETDRRFSLVDSDTGDVVAAGLKTQMFLASTRAMINQAADAPRWAVQSWSGGMLRVIPRRGTPRLHGATLLQFDGDSFVQGNVVTRGDRWVLELPQNPAVYDLVRDGAGDEWFAVGTLGGAIAVTNGGDQWVHTLEIGSDRATSPAIYGIRVTTAGGTAGTGSRSPSMHILHGLNPQVLTRLDFNETGEADHNRIGEIPGQYAVHAPQSIFELDQGLVVVGLREALFVAGVEPESSALIPMEGLSGLSGMGRSTDSLVVATGRGQVGSLILAGARDMSKIAHWQLADGSSMAQVAGRRLSESIVVVQSEGDLVGIEVGL